MPQTVRRRDLTGPEIAAERWAWRKLGDVAHERRVRAIADRLFDLTSKTLHLTEADRTLLRLAALTHDVGRCVSEKDHPRRGAAMLARTQALDLAPSVRRKLAYLARYHRGAVPTADRGEYLKPADATPAVAAVLALLRAADALDSRHLAPPRVMLSFAAGRLAVRCVATERLAEARRVFSRRKKYRLLDALLAHPVRISVSAA